MRTSKMSPVILTDAGAVTLAQVADFHSQNE